MTWRYQLTKETINGHDEYAVREVYFDDEGNLTSWTKDPITLTGDSQQEILEDLIRIRTDIKRGGVLDITGR